MKRKPSGLLSFDTAKEGFLQFKLAEGISQRTYTSYKFDLSLFQQHHGDLVVEEIDSMLLVRYMSWLRTDYKPRRMSGDDRPLSMKTVRNHWVSLSAFFSWFTLEFGGDNPMKRVPVPKIQKRSVDPISKEEIEALLKACSYSEEANTKFRQSFKMRRPTALRDKAIILTLLDTGLRAGEFCALNVGDFDMKNGRLTVKDGDEGGSKGGKGRQVYLGKTARKALWRYLADREDQEDHEAPLFLTKTDRAITPNGLRLLTTSLAEKAGISHCNPHRFRHTFAITYLRSGGDVFTLQSLLGHSSLEMVRHYANIAQIDVEAAHRRASPVDNWRL
jgi:integrase/recombinase XerD